MAIMIIGIAWKISMIRMMIVSTLPPKYPAMIPRRPPENRAAIVQNSAMTSEYLVP